MYACSSVAMVFLASSKLPPPAVTDRLCRAPSSRRLPTRNRNQSLCWRSLAGSLLQKSRDTAAQAPGDVSEDLALHNFLCL